MRLTPYARQRDWFIISEWTPELSMVPGIQTFPGRQIGVHRSHLPLLKDAGGVLPTSYVDLAARAALDAETEPLGFKLRPYQHEGREFIRTRRGTLLADTMRLGKSLECVASHDPASGPLLVVGPLAAREIWVQWMKMRWPDVEPVVLKGRRYNVDQLRDAECLFVHYDILLAWQNFALRKPGTLVFDEAHLISNRRSKRAQAALLLATRAENVIAATGTPLWNQPGGLWSILASLNPGAWGKWFPFAQRYANPQITPYGTKYTGASNEEEFRARISEVMIRRTWEDIRADLPPIERTVEITDLTEKQLFRVETLAEKIRDTTRKITHAGNLARFRRLLGKLKAPLAVDVASRVLDGGEPVVVWTWHRDVAATIADAIAKKGYPAFCATGKQTVTERERITAAWRQVCGALIVTISVGQVAIDLSHARQAVFAEVDYTPTTVAQAEMRTFSPAKPMALTYLVVDHEVDRALVHALQTKCATAETLGVPAADTAIDVIAQAFDVQSSPDMQRLLGAFLAGYEEGD